MKKEEPLLYPKGTRLFWKKNGLPAYEKVGETGWDWWVSLDSKYLVNGELRPESEKPLFNSNGGLNRFGFRQTDEGVNYHYLSIMKVELPKL